MKGQSSIQLKDAIRRVDKIISSARANIISKWRDAGWLGPYYLWHRLYIPSPLDMQVVNDLQGEYLVIGYDDDGLVYLLDLSKDSVYVSKYEYFLKMPYTVYIWQDNYLEGVYVSYETYQRYGKARFIPFIWVQVIRDLLIDRDPSYVGRRLPNISVNMWKMRDLASKYRRGREKKITDDIFKHYPINVEQDIMCGRFFEGVYMVLAVDVNGYTVRMLFDQVLPPELSHYMGFYRILEISRPFERGGWEMDFWNFLSGNQPILIVYDHIWGAFFLVVDYPYAYPKKVVNASGIVFFPDPSGRFWRILIHSKNVFGHPTHQTWYIPPKYWKSILQTVHVK